MSDILRPGEWCDGNEIVRLVGRGGHAEVYEALDRCRVRRAIKLLAADPGLASKLQARIAQEGQALATIDHPNVVRFFGSGLYEDRVYLVLEFVDGKSLLQRMDRVNGLVPLEDIVRWIRDACQGVAEAHRQRVIHRDIKPSNILITNSDAVKVIDFGVAKLRGWGVRTTSEQSLGTALFTAPEQLRKVPPDERTDVYSMGMILYQAIAGTHPMGPGPWNLADVVTWQLTVQPRRLRDVAPEVPLDLDDLVRRALEKDPARRLPSMRVFAAELNKALGHQLAPLRRVALNALPSREATLAPTVGMPVMNAPGSAPAGVGGGTISMHIMRPATSTAPSMNPGGTLARASVTTSPPSPTWRPSSNPGRGAPALAPPPAVRPPGDAAMAGATSGHRAAWLPVTQGVGRGPAGSPRPQPLLATTASWDAAAPLPGKEHSSDTPVERAIVEAPRRQNRGVIGAGVGGIVMVLVAGGWALLGRSPSPKAPPTTTATAPAPTSSAQPAVVPPPPASVTLFPESPASSTPSAPVPRRPRQPGRGTASTAHDSPAPPPPTARNRLFDINR